MLAAVACGAVAPAALAGAPSSRTTFLLSRAFDGGLPNGVSRNPAVSHDQRIARVMAYESDATNIVADDTNGLTDVFVVHRGGPGPTTARPGRSGPRTWYRTASAAQPANGRSYRPALDGDSHHAPSCVAFVSDASNLVPGDTNGKPDAFVYNIAQPSGSRACRWTSHGRQSNGSTFEVAVDGDCERVAFVSDATNLALTRHEDRRLEERRDERRARRHQAGLREGARRVRRSTRASRGLTFLASARTAAAPGTATARTPSPAPARPWPSPRTPAT